VPGKNKKLRVFFGDTIGVEKLLDHTNPAEMLQIKLPAMEKDCREIRVEVI
jgi:hypothetical protein